MKQDIRTYRVLVPTVLIGTVRASKGDIVRRELLGVQLRKYVDQGIVEPVLSVEARRAQVSVL